MYEYNPHPKPPAARGGSGELTAWWRNARYATLNVLMMGGAERMLEAAEMACEQGEYAWVTELCERILFGLMPPRKEALRDKARLLCADALEQLSYAAPGTSPLGDECARAAQDLREGQVYFVRHPFLLGADDVDAMSPEAFLDWMGRLVATQPGPDSSVAFGFWRGGEGWLRREGCKPSYGLGEPEEPPTLRVEGEQMDIYRALVLNEDEARQGLDIEGSDDDFEALIRDLQNAALGFAVESYWKNPAGPTRELIYECLAMVEGYESRVREKTGAAHGELVVFDVEDMVRWKQAYYPLLVETHVLMDDLFFAPDGSAPGKGIGRDGMFYRREYDHFLYEARRQLVYGLKPPGDLVAGCVELFERYIRRFKDDSEKQPTLPFTGEDRRQWEEIYQPKLFIDAGVGGELEDAIDIGEVCRILASCYRRYT